MDNQKPTPVARPWASKAQRERCRQLVADGKMTQAAFDAAEGATKDLEALPERLHPKKEKKEGDA